MTTTPLWYLLLMGRERPKRQPADLSSGGNPYAWIGLFILLAIAVFATFGFTNGLLFILIMGVGLAFLGGLSL